MHAVAPLIDESSGESPLTVEYPGNGVVRFNAATRVAIKRYNHAVTWATRHFISLISISKKYESNFNEWPEETQVTQRFKRRISCLLPVSRFARVCGLRV